MSDVMRVDPVALREAQPAFDSLAAAVGGVLSRLTGALSAEGRCWGGDDVGRHFEPDYLDGVRDTGDGLAAVRDVATRIGQSLLDAADAVDAAEDRSRSRFA
jgi:uncharacterized protein YukE